MANSDLGIVIYDPESIVMDRKITCSPPKDDNNRSYLYYADDDGSEIICEMDADAAEALVVIWNEAIDEDVQLQKQVTYLSDIHRKSIANADKALDKEKARGDRAKVRAVAAVNRRKDAMAKTLEEKKRTVASYKALLEVRADLIKQLQAKVKAKDMLLQKYMDYMEENGLTPWEDDENLTDESEPREDYVDREEKLENHHDTRDHHEEM